ncbi:MAG: phosphatidate cytidylyltransferase [Candidatus Hydrogenedentes bacterium]|nr:phosphatidate cytidylyltransferase [Candidatus Hydrogenedentota bacterium]
MRLATAFVLIPAVLVLTWMEHWDWGFSILISVFAAIGLYEYYAIVRARQISPETIGGILAGTAITLSGHFNNPTLTNFMLYGGSLLVSALHIVRGQHSVAGLASSLFGVFYVGWLGAHITLLHSEPEFGPALVTVLFVAIVLNDSAAYLFGSLLGRHRLAPKVSPHKTWEGAVAGLVFALLGLWGLHYASAAWNVPILPGWSAPRYLHCGATLSIVAQVGDLAESCLKRDAAVKDSGALFPGHGGVLDRCDGFLFAAPVLYYMFHFFAPY